MARKCQSKNPSQCSVHGMGGKEEQLNLALNKALANGDHQKAFEIQQQKELLSDAVEARKTEKLSFFERIASRFHTLEVKPVVTPSQPMGETSQRAETVQEVKSYTGLLEDCGTCNSCDPPPSDLTHFRHLSNGTCARPIPMSAKNVTHRVISRTRAFNSGRTPEQIEELQNKITSVLEDSAKSSIEGGASKAAEEVRDILWDDFSEKNGNKDTSKGGFTSAASTTDLFHALGREKELGWISDDAPGYNYKVASDLKTETLFGNMQQLLSESPSSFTRRHEGKH